MSHVLETVWCQLDGHNKMCVACGQELERDGANLYFRTGDKNNINVDNIDVMCNSCHNDLRPMSKGNPESTLTNIERRFPYADREKILHEYLKEIN